MKSVKPQGSSHAAAGPPKVQQAESGAAKPAPEKVGAEATGSKEGPFLNQHPPYASYFLCRVSCNKVLHVWLQILKVIMMMNDAGDSPQDSHPCQWIAFTHLGASAAPYVLMK